MLLQDIIKDDEIKLDWFFKMSLIHDLVNVSFKQCVSLIYLELTDFIVYGISYQYTVISIVFNFSDFRFVILFYA